MVPPIPPRIVKVAAAQVGRVDRTTSRAEVLDRLIRLLDTAGAQGVKLVVFPEIALTTFFPRYLIEDEAELDSFFERGDPLDDPNTAPLFRAARDKGVDVVLGYAELTPEGRRFNTSVYFSASGNEIVAKYRKVHLPGTVEPFADPEATNQLEKRYFEPGDLGFRAFRAPDLVPGALKKGDPTAVAGDEAHDGHDGRGDPIVGMLICNDRRWPEAWRVLTLQGAELVVIGFNTGANMPHLWGNENKGMSPQEAEEEALFHSRLVQQANSYQNACWSVSAARTGNDDGKYDLIAGSAIVNPEGRVVAESRTKEDELVVAEIDLAECRQGKEKTFAYERHRRVEHYGPITSQTGVVEPALL